MARLVLPQAEGKAAAIYFVLTFTITRILRLIEKKMDGKQNYVLQGSQNLDASSYAKETAGGNKK